MTEQRQKLDSLAQHKIRRENFAVGIKLQMLKIFLAEAACAEAVDSKLICLLRAPLVSLGSLGFLVVVDDSSLQTDSQPKSGGLV